MYILSPSGIVLCMVQIHFFPHGYPVVPTPFPHRSQCDPRHICDKVPHVPGTVLKSILCYTGCFVCIPMPIPYNLKYCTVKSQYLGRQVLPPNSFLLGMFSLFLAFCTFIHFRVNLATSTHIKKFLQRFGSELHCINRSICGSNNIFITLSLLIHEHNISFNKVSFKTFQ